MTGHIILPRATLGLYSPWTPGGPLGVRRNTAESSRRLGEGGGEGGREEGKSPAGAGLALGVLFPTVSLLSQDSLARLWS